MNPLWKIADEIRAQGKVSSFQSILDAIEERNLSINKDELIELFSKDKRMGFHSTPNELSFLMAEIGRSFKPQNVIDISCGLGNNLFYCDFTDDRTGIEINSEVVALVNYLFPDLAVIQADSLKYEFSQRYDLVISSFPMGGRNEIDGRRKPLEHFFIQKGLEILAPRGTLICLIPDSLLFTKTAESLRKEILSQFSLEMTISLPQGIIQNTFVKTTILVIRNRPQVEKVFLADYADRPNLLKKYQNGSGEIWIESTKIGERWDRSFFGTAYMALEKELDATETKNLDELAEIIRGVQVQSSERKSEGDYLLFKPRHIKKEGFSPSEKDQYIDSKQIPQSRKCALLQPGDLLFSRIYREDFLYVYRKNDPPAVADANIIIIRSANRDYLATYLQTEEGRKVFSQQVERVSSGAIMPMVTISALKAIRIPIIPIEDLNLLSDSYLSNAKLEELQEIKSILSENESRFLKAIESHPKTVNEPTTVYGGQAIPNEFSLLMAFMENRFQALTKRLASIEGKVDQVLTLLQAMDGEIKDIKKLHREDDEKIRRIYRSLDKKLGGIIKKAGKDIQSYIEEIKYWFEFWDLLETASQRFLPQAEFLFDELGSLDNPDYSPFILQYCRALENEILIKLFSAYHSWLEVEGTDRNELVESDLENKKTKTFAISIRRNRKDYTLGTMKWVMALMRTDGNTYRASPLLQNFRSFTLQHFQENLLEKEYLDSIQSITDTYRNKAAHPNVLDGETARSFHGEIKECLIGLLENYKSSAK